MRNLIRAAVVGGLTLAAIGAGTLPASSHVPNRAPYCSLATISPTRILWSPQHSLVTATVSGVRDPDGDPVTTRIIAVTQDEPLLGTGSGDTAPDAVLGPASNQVRLRAERAGSGDGRVYAVWFRGTDVHGASCTSVRYVQVPHSSSSTYARNSGQRYNSLLSR